jgi:PBP1b-binding outer membrane lipoprotein LpoB
MRANGIIAIVAIVLAGCATPEPATPTTEPQIATVQPQRLQVKRRMERPVRTTVPDARSPHEVQIARNVTAILRGMRHAELERLAEVMPCKEGDIDCE